MGKYQKTSIRKKENKIIPMPLDANFFFERALHHLDRNDFSKALKYFWRIVDVEPENPVHYCNLAGLLSEMGRFKESNELLLYVVEKLDSQLSECYYYIANNYAYLEELELSFKYIHRYLDEDPKGEYVEEAQEMLSYISTEVDEFDYDTDEDEKNLLIAHYKAKNLLEEGKYYEAIKKFRQMVTDNPDFLAARNNLALAYFYMGNYVKAIEQSKAVLDKESTNIHAICNLSIFYQHLNEKDELEALKGFLKKVHPFNRQHLYKLATTFALLGEHELAYQNLSRIITKKHSLNPTIYHYLAVSSFNTNRRTLAKKYWQNVIKLDSNTEIADFYLHLLHKLPENDSDFQFPVFSYQYELPYDHLLNGIKSKPSKYGTPFIHISFEWGLTHGEQKIKEQIITGLATIKTKEVELILRNMLLDSAHTYDLKKKALIALEEIDAKSPYEVLLNGERVQMDRQTPNLELWKKNWIQVLDMVEETIGEKYNVIELFDAKTLWFDFINKTYPNTPIIRKIEGWVAALEYIVASMHQKTVSAEKLANRYMVTKQTILKNASQIRDILKINKKRNYFPFS